MIENLKQKTYAITINPFTIYFLIFGLALTVIFYVYFANDAVRTLTVLEKTKFEIQNLSVKISEYESDRLFIENSLNTEKALSLGFTQVNKPNFLMKIVKNTSLSIKN